MIIGSGILLTEENVFLSTTWATASYTYISTADTGLGSLVGSEVKDSMRVRASKIDFGFGPELGMTAFYSSGSSYLSGSLLI